MYIVVNIYLLLILNNLLRFCAIYLTLNDFQEWGKISLSVIFNSHIYKTCHVEHYMTVASVYTISNVHLIFIPILAISKVIFKILY